MKTTLRIAAAALVLGLAGCYQYVNIPADSGDVAMHSANGDHVVNAEYEALRAVVADMHLSGPYRIVLPFNTYATTYDHLCERLGGGATWASATTQPAAATQPDMLTLEVAHVYIRGFAGSVDIIRPAELRDPSGVKQLVTVSLNLYAVGGWSAKRLEVWRMSVDQALIQSKNTTPGSTP